MQDPAVKKYFQSIGEKGGRSGRGEAKRRGDSEYYKQLRRKRTYKAKGVQE